MCFSKQPSAPTNKPAYAPEDADKYFTSSVEEDGEAVRKLAPPSAEEEAAKAAPAPKQVATHKNIRM